MKQQLLQIRTFDHSRQSIVFACAWCPAQTYPKLESYQEYTHGMCQEHKREFMQTIQNRAIQRQLEPTKQIRIPKSMQLI